MRLFMIIVNSLKSTINRMKRDTRGMLLILVKMMSHLYYPYLLCHP